MNPKGIKWVAGDRYIVKKPIFLIDGAEREHEFPQSQIVVYAGCRMIDNILFRYFNVGGTIFRTNRMLMLEHNLAPQTRKRY